MKAEVLNAFFRAAVETLRCEIKDSVHRGALTATIDPTLDSEVTVFLGAVGNPRGLVLFGMSRETALALASRMAGMPFATLDDLVLSAVAELGNVVTGRALMALSEQGYTCDLTPPSVMVGKGAYFSTLGIPRIRIPLQTSLGEIRLDVALQESS
ncbi:MAG: chemotaxis protein CheX [Firmicutes bacterium]|nr:chemotaxis protein CheX [Bacillota bacterium]